MNEEIIIGAPIYSASRAFIPIIHTRALLHEPLSVFDARPIAIISLEGDDVYFFPFRPNLEIEDLRKKHHDIDCKITEVKKILQKSSP